MTQRRQKRGVMRLILLHVAGSVIKVTAAWNCPKPLRQFLIKLALFLFLGTIVNAAVVLGCWYWGDRRNQSPMDYVFLGEVSMIAWVLTLWVLYLAARASGRIRRRIIIQGRIKRGLCPACAYPVGTSELCTECGQAVRS